MHELFIQKIQVAISILSIVASWVVAQISLIQQGFDQLFSLGLLIVAVVAIWKAFNKKDESETRLLKEIIEMQKDTIRVLRKRLEDK